MPKILLAGYFGCGNLGDDALMLGFLDALNGTELDVGALTGFPNETYSRYGIHSIPRKDMKAVDTAIEQYDALVFPGGSIFQDVTSIKSAAYYNMLVRKAKAKKKKVLLLGQGVGPLNSFAGKQLAKSAFNAADAIAVRDPDSMQTLVNLGVRKKIFLTADSAYLLKPSQAPEGVANFGFGGMKSIALAPRPHGKGDHVVQLFGEICRTLYQARIMPVLVPLDKNEDIPLIQEISKSQGGKIPDLKGLESPLAFQSNIMRMEGLIAMRLHAGILASMVGVPPFMLSYDPKVAAFSRLLGTTPAVKMEGLTAQRCVDLFMEHQANAETQKKVIATKTEELRAKALDNVSILLDTLKSRV